MNLWSRGWQYSELATGLQQCPCGQWAVTCYIQEVTVQHSRHESQWDKILESQWGRTLESQWDRTLESQWNKILESQWSRTLEAQWDKILESQWCRTLESQWDETLESQWNRTVSHTSQVIVTTSKLFRFETTTSGWSSRHTQNVNMFINYE